MGKDENVIIAAIIKIKRTTEKVLRFLNFLNNVRSKKQTGLSPSAYIEQQRMKE